MKGREFYLSLHGKNDMNTENDKHNRPVLNADTKLSDALERDYNLLNVLLRLGIRLGFGERTIGEACRDTGIDTGSFLLIANVYVEDFCDMPEKENISSSALDLVKYLRASHSYYMDVLLKHLEDLLDSLLKPCAQAQRNVIMSFFSEYREEVKNHFDYEEDIVFPYVKAITEGKTSEEYSISKFEEHHNDIDTKLYDLRSIIMKYLPPVCDSSLAVMVLFHLRALEEDLEKHTVIEDSILIPMVNTLEENVRD